MICCIILKKLQIKPGNRVETSNNAIHRFDAVNEIFFGLCFLVQEDSHSVFNYIIVACHSTAISNNKKSSQGSTRVPSRKYQTKVDDCQIITKSLIIVKNVLVTLYYYRVMY